jgi:hypothetical protein
VDRPPRAHLGLQPSITFDLDAMTAKWQSTMDELTRDLRLVNG